MAKLRVGLVGVGSIALDHLAGLSQVAQAEVFALSSRNRQAVTSAAERFGASVWYQDYRELIANEDVQAVWVCTPNRLHYPMAMEVLEADKHLFLEKPMAETIGQCREIAEAAAARHLCVSLCYLSRYMPVYEEAHRMVAAGEIGKPIMFIGRRMWWRDSFPGWWAEEKRLAIPHFGSHSIDLGVWFLGGRGASVFAAAESKKEEFPGESEYALVARMTTGGIISLEFSMSSRHVQFDHVLVGEEGTLTMRGTSILLNGEPHFEVGEDELYGSAFYGEAKEFVAAVHEGRPSLTSAEEALKSMEIVDAAVKSADANESVTL